MRDFMDRQATPWHRAWVILSGIWLVALAPHIPAAAGTAIAGIGWVMIVAALGAVELAMALWYRILRKSEPDQNHGPTAAGSHDVNRSQREEVRP